MNPTWRASNFLPKILIVKLVPGNPPLWKNVLNYQQPRDSWWRLRPTSRYGSSQYRPLDFWVSAANFVLGQIICLPSQFDNRWQLPLYWLNKMLNKSAIVLKIKIKAIIKQLNIFDRHWWIDPLSLRIGNQECHIILHFDNLFYLLKWSISSNIDVDRYRYRHYFLEKSILFPFH